MTEPHVVGEGTEEGNSLPDEHGHAGDDEALNEPRPQESLNRDADTDVEVVGTRGP